MTFSYVNKLKLFLFALVFILFANTITHDFAWDDSIVITENARVQKGISGIPDLFFKYNSDYKADKYGYRPITLTSFALEYKISKANPHLMHFMNVFYFALLCIIIFNVLSKLFSNYSVFFNFICILFLLVSCVTRFHLTSFLSLLQSSAIACFAVAKYFLIFG